MKKENTRWLYKLIAKLTNKEDNKKHTLFNYFGHKVTFFHGPYVVNVTNICIDDTMEIFIDYDLQMVQFENTPDSYIESILNSLKELYPSFTWKYEACYSKEEPIPENAKLWENHQIFPYDSI